MQQSQKVKLNDCIRNTTAVCNRVTYDHDVIFRKVFYETKSSFTETVTLHLVKIKPYHHKAVYTNTAMKYQTSNLKMEAL